MAAIPLSSTVVSASGVTSHSECHSGKTAKSQTRLLGPTGSDVRFQATGSEAVTTEIGAQSGHAE